jgi:4-carboxymuconolactone decarboxylase
MRQEGERYVRGWDKLIEVTGDKGRQTMERWREFSPDICDFIVEFAYGDIYTREALDLKQRMTVTLTALIVQGGCEKELSVHVGSALNVGLQPKEIVEVAIHCVPYIGFPRVTNALSVMRSVFEDKGITWSPE